MTLSGRRLNPRQQEIFQAKDHSGEDARLILVAGGERAGKSELTADYGYSFFPWSSLIWIQGPDYEQARHEFRYIFRNADEIGAVVSASMPNAPGPWRMVLQGGVEVETKSATDPEKIAGRAPDVVLMVEAGQQPYEAFLRAMGRIAEKRGRLFVSGTFEGSIGWYPETWMEWQSANDAGGISFSLPTWSNTDIFPGGRQDPEILRLERSWPPEVFSERFAGVPMPPRGLVFPDFKTKIHVRDDLIEAIRRQVVADELPVAIWQDPGYEHPYAAEFVAVVNDTVYVLDEVYVQHQITEDVVQICQTKPLWKYVTHTVMDVAGKQHHGAKSPEEVWRRLTGLPIHMNPVGIEDGILRTHTFLRPDPMTGQPRLFVSSRCSGLINELTKLYRYPVDDDGMAISTKPKDKYNDAAKALAYGLVEKFGLANIKQKRGAIQRFKPVWETKRRWLRTPAKRRAS